MQSVAVRAMPADVRDYRFVRGGSVDIGVVYRLYDDRGVRVAAGTGVVSSTAVGFADLIGSAVPDNATWFLLSYRSTGAATTMLYDTGVTPDTYSPQLTVQVSTGSYDTIAGGRTPLA